MSESPCQTCGKPIADGTTICVTCGLVLDAAVADICAYRGLAYDLAIARARQAVLAGSAGITRPPEPSRAQDHTVGILRPTPWPFNRRAATAAEQLLAALVTWTRLIRDETDRRPIAGPVCRRCDHPSCRMIRLRRPPPEDLADLAAWFRPHIGWLRHHAAAAAAFEEITDAVAAARRAVDRPADKLYAGPCDCGDHLYARLDTTYVQCPACRSVWRVEARRLWLLRSAEDLLLTTTEISRAITRLTQQVTPEMIRGYVNRGRLLARGTTIKSGNTVPVYRLGDVLDILAQQTEKRRLGA